MFHLSSLHILLLRMTAQYVLPVLIVRSEHQVVQRVQLDLYPVPKPSHAHNASQAHTGLVAQIVPIVVLVPIARQVPRHAHRQKKGLILALEQVS